MTVGAGGDDDEVLDNMSASFKVRRHLQKLLNLIINREKRPMPEDCGYCSQSIASTAPVQILFVGPKIPLVDGA